MDMTTTLERLPRYLQRYCVHQDYDKYTPREHATWRYIMRQNKAFFAKHAVPIYLEGLELTAIPEDRIPDIDEVDASLQRFGYGAVGVCGFIPPAVFLEFQARGIMPIATDMRTLEHVDYTPAPDIVHEAAGHVPIVADPDYRNYLKQYGQCANRALFSEEDLRLYEAIRYLSDIKENPDTKPEELDRAQERLEVASKAVSFVSESAKVGRMGWWTIEYGLVGDPAEPKIYGAGLLSSVGESQACLSIKVKKIPLDIHCTDQSFDITEPQPQLFIAPTLADLPHSLKELEHSLSFYKGGLDSLELAKKCATTNTIKLDSGLEFCGKVETILNDGSRVDFVKVQGPSQLCYEETVLENHSAAAHPDGFSTPIGFWQGLGDMPPQKARDGDLEKLGLIAGHHANLTFANGFKVSGVVTELLRKDGILICVSWEQCSVTRAGKLYYDPDWGKFDMAVGTKVVSVFSGPADRDAFGDYDVGTASSAPGRSSPFTSLEQARFGLYETLRELRLQSDSGLRLKQLEGLLPSITEQHSGEWLLLLEALELIKQSQAGQTQQRLIRQCFDCLNANKDSYSNTTIDLIDKALLLCTVK